MGGEALMRYLAIVGLLLMSGCSSLTTKRGESSKYAPSNEARGGAVKYNNQGFGADGRRKSAYKRMYDHCKGPYKITSEHASKEGGGAVPAAGMVIYTPGQEMVYIDFQCEVRQ